MWLDFRGWKVVGVAILSRSMSYLDKTPVRRLHLIDLENLAGRPVVSIQHAEEVAQRLNTCRPPGETDLRAVGVAHSSGFAAKFAFPGAHVRWRSGKDGGDLVLLDYAGQLPLSRFDELVVASADAIFAGTVIKARREGLKVTIVADQARASFRYLRTADQVIHFPAVAA